MIRSGTSSKQPKMKLAQTALQYVIAHRCNGFNHKENSLEAIKAALESNADAIEIDIRLTKDNVWVIHHDPHYKNSQKKIILVQENDFEDIKNEITPLDKILPFVKSSGKEIFLDIKDTGNEKGLLSILAKHKLKQKTIIISWEPLVLIETHKLDPKIRIGLSYVPIHRVLDFITLEIEDPVTYHKGLLNINQQNSFDNKSMKKYTNQHYLSKLPDLRIPLYSIQVYAPFCSTKLVNLAHEKGIKVYPFTVDTTVMNTLLKLRLVDGIITNKPMKFKNSDFKDNLMKTLADYKTKMTRNKKSNSDGK